MSMVGLTSLAPYGIIPLPNMINIWAATLIDEIEYYYTGVKSFKFNVFI